MITEEDIAKQHKRTIASPIRIGELTDFGINSADFICFCAPFFENLSDDLYAVGHKQLHYLKTIFPEDIDTLDKVYAAGTTAALAPNAYTSWINKLSHIQKIRFEQYSQVTRQRAIASFEVTIREDKSYHIYRSTEEGFHQDVSDLRAKKRVFTQVSNAAVEHAYFQHLLHGVAKLVHTIHTELKPLKITGHWMRTMAQSQLPGENAPEGIHEDGAAYILSALVINRENIRGGATQIFEKSKTGETTLLFDQELAPGHFAFQADTGEEYTFGNDLWHYVTPIQQLDTTQPGIRDIIGFDIDIIA